MWYDFIGECEMKEYAFEKMNYKMDFVVKRPEKDYRSVILDYAKRGYRYVGYIPCEVLNSGAISTIDLIFEKDI